MNGDNTSLAQRSKSTTFFSHKDMDYYFSWILARHTFGGADPEECFEVAGKIIDGNLESWQEEWKIFAQNIETRAEKACSQNDNSNSGKDYMHACSYYRATILLMSPSDPDFKNNIERMQYCFKRATEILDMRIEKIYVPYRDNNLPGFFLKADTSSIKHPLLITIGGIETFLEDLYFITGPYTIEHGYNALFIDLPGQGMTPEQKLYFRPKIETAIKPMLDYLMIRPDVDTERLALFGLSWGGHLALRAAQHDSRIKALIANPPNHDIWRNAAKQQNGQKSKDPVTKIIFEQLKWRFGVSKNIQRIPLIWQYLTSGRINCSEIKCPVLCMAGAGEDDDTLLQAHECYEVLPNQKKKLVITTVKDGSDAHCQIDNLNLLNNIVFNWLDDIFK